MNIPFSPPDITEAEISEVAEALRSGWITTGPRVRQFEKDLAEYCGVGRAVCLNSATASLEMTLRFLGIGPGDEVITSAYTYTASASPVIHCGASVKFVDTAPDSFEMDYDALEEAVNEKTKVIIPVDLGGLVCDYNRIFSIVERKKSLFRPSNEIQKKFGRVIVVADCAHAMGSVRFGKRTGSIADFTAFSFHAVKNLTTAEGGATLWRHIDGVDDEDIYNWIQRRSLHGQTKDALAKSKLGAWEYDIVEPAYKCNMTDLTAALGIVQLKRYPEMLARRREMITRYDAGLLPLGIQSPRHYTDDMTSCGHLYLTRIPGITEEQRNRFITLMAERGVATNVHFKPLPMMTAYRALGADIKDFPNAYKQYANEVTVPLHTKLKDEEIDYIIETYKEALKVL